MKIEETGIKNELKAVSLLFSISYRVPGLVLFLGSVSAAWLDPPGSRDWGKQSTPSCSRLHYAYRLNKLVKFLYCYAFLSKGLFVRSVKSIF